MRIALALIGVVAGLAASFTVTPRYRSHALIALRAPLAYEVLQSAQDGLLSRQSLASTICDPALSLYPAERRVEPMEDVEEVMRTDITLANPPSPDRDKAFLRIAYVYSDPLKAQGTLRHLISNIRPKAPAAGQTAVNPDQPYLDEIAVFRSRIAVLEHRYGLETKPEPVMHVSSPSPTTAASRSSSKSLKPRRPKRSSPTRSFSQSAALPWALSRLFSFLSCVDCRLICR